MGVLTPPTPTFTYGPGLLRNLNPGGMQSTRLSFTLYQSPAAPWIHIPHPVLFIHQQRLVPRPRHLPYLTSKIVCNEC